MGVVKKTGIAVVALLVVVGAVFAIIGVVQKNNESPAPAPAAHPNESGIKSVSTASKTVDTICAPTEHKEACVSSLKDIKADASIQDYLVAAVKATLAEVKKAINVTDNVVIDKDDDPYNDVRGMEDCKYFLAQTVEQLDAAISEVQRIDIATIQKSTKDFISWLTGANVFLQTCVDDMGKPEYKSAVINGTQSATELVQNALYIFAKISDILGNLDIADTLVDFLSGNTTGKVNSTILDDVADASGFPNWVSNKDRKLLVGPEVPLPNITVAQDGTGQFKTINEAIAAAPVSSPEKFIIYVKAGTYNEQVNIKDRSNLVLFGDGIGKTIITNNQSNLKGGSTSTTATVGIDSSFVLVKGITIENSAGAVEHQAVALRINGLKVVIFECEMKSFQDTLYYHRGIHFFKNCIISGTVDFIFGYGRAIIQDSVIVARKPDATQANMITADGGLSPVGQHGLVVQNCKIVAEPELMATKNDTKTFLGRPWKPYAITIFLQNQIDDFIVPEGYSVFTVDGPDANNQVNAIYGEYLNTGAGANTTARDTVTFKHFKVLTPPEAEVYTVAKYIDGAAWLPQTGIAFKAGL